MTLTVPRSMYDRPARLWCLLAWTLMRHRTSYFLVLPPFVAASLALGGSRWSDVLTASLASLLLGWLFLATHEYAHVALLLSESRGYATVSIDIAPGGWRVVTQTVARHYAALAKLAAHAGVPLPAPRSAPASTAGYFRVCSNMVLSSRAKARIAIAGTVFPVLLWLCLLAAYVVFFRAGFHRSAVAFVAALAGSGVYIVVHPVFSGLLYHGAAYSDLGYAAEYFAQCIDIARHDALVTLALIAGAILRQLPRIVVDVVAYTVMPGRVVSAAHIADKKPKRTCLSWIYKRDEQGQFTDRIVLVLPLGMAFFQLLNKDAPGADRNILTRLSEDPERLQRLQSFRKVFLMELDELSSRAWELADGNHTFASIVETLHVRTGLPYDRIESGLSEFFFRLHRGYILNVEWPAAPVRQYPRLADVVFDFGEFGSLTRQLFARA